MDVIEPKRKQCIWYALGMVALLPWMAGCASTVLPGSEVPPSGYGRANNLVTATASAKSTESSAIRPVRFDTARFNELNSAAGPEDFTGAQDAEKARVMEATATQAPKMTFDQAVGTTLMADPKIRAGLELINQARADLLTSSLLPNPTVLTDGLMFPTRTVTPLQTSGPPQMDVQVGYPIDWFLFGKRVAAMRSAGFGVQQSESDYADLIRQRVGMTATAFFDVVEAKALLKLAQQDTENLRKLYTVTKKAVDAGGRPIVELNRIRLDLLKTEQMLREAELTRAVTKARLRSLFGRTDADPDFDVAADLDAPLTAEPLPIENAYVLAQENRPDIQSLRVQVSKADADIIVERRKAFPQITPAFGYTRQYQGQALGQPDADTWGVTVTTTVPLFDRNQGNRAKAMSISTQNALNLDAALVDLRAEITQVVQEFMTAYKNTQAVAQEQKKTAQDVLDSITKAYEVGGRPLIDVLDAQRNYRETYRLYISSRANYWRSAYRFSTAVGKKITE